MVRVTIAVKNTHTVFARYKLDQEMILLGWSFHTLCRERKHYAILGEKIRSMRCNIWSVQVWRKFSMKEVTFFCTGSWYLGFIQQGTKQAYNYSFEECLKRATNINENNLYKLRNAVTKLLKTQQDAVCIMQTTTTCSRKIMGHAV